MILELEKPSSILLFPCELRGSEKRAGLGCGVWQGFAGVQLPMGASVWYSLGLVFHCLNGTAVGDV